MNAVVDITCNETFPYVNGFAIVNIILGAWLLLITFILYFLTTRLEFFGFLDGDWNNYGEKTVKTTEISADQEMSDRNKDFLTTTDRRDI